MNAVSVNTNGGHLDLALKQDTEGLVDFFSGVLDDEIEQDKLTQQRKPALVRAVKGIHAGNLAHYKTEQLIVSQCPVLETAELKESATVVNVTRTGTRLRMDMTCAKMELEDSGEANSKKQIRVRMCFANAVANNCSS